MRTSNRPLYIGLIPILALTILVIIFRIFPPSAAVIEPPLLLPILNTVFLFLVSCVVAYVAMRSYLMDGSLPILMLGSGVLTFGTGAMMSGWAINVYGPNANVTIFNVSALMASVFHIAAVIATVMDRPPETDPVSRRQKLTAALTGVSVFLLLLSTLNIKGIMPPFFVQGEGPTAIRQVVLATALVLFVVSSSHMMSRFFREKRTFFYWYSLALALLAIGTVGILLQPAVGSPIGWVGRGAQYLAGIYFLLSVHSALRDARLLKVSLNEAVAELFRTPGFHWRDILKTAINGFWITDTKGRFLEVNEACCRILGYTRAELLSMTVADVEAVETPSDVLSHIEAARGKTTDHFISRHRRKDGSVIDVEVNATYLDVGTGQVVIFFQDITERKRAERRLAADLGALTRMHALSTRFLKASGTESLLQEIMDAAVAIVGAERGVLQLVEGDSLRIVAHHGHERPFLEFFASDRDQASVCGEAMKHGQRVVVEDVERSPLFAGTPSLDVLRDAGVRAVQSTPLLSRQGKMLGILTTQWGVPYVPDEHDLWRIDLLARQTADLLEHKRAEEQIKRSEQRLQLALDAADLGIWDFEPRSGVVECEPRIKAWWGLLPEQTYTYDVWLDRLHNEDREAAVAEVCRSLEPDGAGRQDMEYRVVRSDGSERWVSVHGRTHFAEEHGSRRAVRVIGTMQDITERKQMEEALRKAHDELEGKVRERTVLLAETNRALLDEIADRKRIEARLRQSIKDRKQAQVEIKSAHEKLRALTSELTLSEERERQRISAILHDDVAQALAVAKLRCEMVVAASEDEHAAGEYVEVLKEIGDYLGRSIHVTRSLMAELSPQVLYELGFVAAMEWLTERFESKHALPVEFRSDGGFGLPPYEEQVLLFQATRELLTNIVKHAGARSVQVDVSGGEDQVKVEVSDDGSGFKTMEVDPSREDGFGLFSIRERLRHFGGRLEIHSVPGSGSRVAMVIPREGVAGRKEKNK